MGNHKKAQPLKNRFSETLLQNLLPQEEIALPIPLTVIVPVYNCSEAIGRTFESLLKQNYTPLEVIVVDAGSTDRTLQIVNSYAPLINRIYTVATFNISDMVNRGISLATGQYITFLFPGTFYLSDQTYETFAENIEKNNFPDLIYCGSIQREIKREPRTIFLPFEVKLIEQGKNPATLPACWFRKEVFETIGKFNPFFTIRPGYDFFCRFTLEEKVCAVAIDRVYVDFDYGRFSYGKILRFAHETWNILYGHFGFKKALHWFLTINHLLIAKWIWRGLKEHIFKSR